MEMSSNKPCPTKMGFDYQGMSYQEQKAARGFRMGHLWPLVALRIPVLAALYESWSLPWSVLLSTPSRVRGPRRAVGCAALCSAGFLPAYMVQMENDVYTQIGLVMLIGLGAKNSI